MWWVFYKGNHKCKKGRQCLKFICILACFVLLSYKGSFVGGQQEGGLHLGETVGSSESYITGESYHARAHTQSHTHTSFLHSSGLSSSQSSVMRVNLKHPNGEMQHHKFQDNNQKLPFSSSICKVQFKPKEWWKDTVCPREESPSSEKFSHDAAHWPNVHCFIQ